MDGACDGGLRDVMGRYKSHDIHKFNKVYQMKQTITSINFSSKTLLEML
jgi:hypothetical protein